MSTYVLSDVIIIIRLEIPSRITCKRGSRGAAHAAKSLRWSV